MTESDFEAMYEHELRTLVDEYRGMIPQKRLARTTDVVRMELEHGNYQPARDGHD
jgi:hypothetical protein